MFSSKMGRKIDYSSMTSAPNVDTLCDVLVSTQQEQGIDVSMVESEYTKSGEKIPRFRRRDDNIIDTRTGEILDMSQERDMPVVKASSLDRKSFVVKSETKREKPKKPLKEEKSNKPKRHIPLYEKGFNRFYNGLFGDGDDEDDDDDDMYICEYCINLGYTNKYKAHVCDNCTKCEGCSEFGNGSCDGCSYSRTRTGHLYSEGLGLEEIVDPDDIVIMNNIEEDNGRRCYRGFSTLDY